QQDDAVRSQPVSDYWHRDGRSNKQKASFQAPVTEISEQGSSHKRCDEVPQTAACLDHRPVARRNLQGASLSVHGHAAPLEQHHGRVGSAVHERRQQKLPKRNGKEEEPQRKRQLSTQRQPEDRDDRELDHKEESKLRDRWNRGKLRGEPCKTRQSQGDDCGKEGPRWNRTKR